MIFRKITKVLVIWTVIIWVCWDVLAFVQHNDSTISVFIWGWSQRYPIISFGAGVLAGHLFFPAKPIKLEDIQ